VVRDSLALHPSWLSGEFPASACPRCVWVYTRPCGRRSRCVCVCVCVRCVCVFVACVYVYVCVDVRINAHSYRLVGVVCHHGERVKGGHYTSFVRLPKDPPGLAHTRTHTHTHTHRMGGVQRRLCKERFTIPRARDGVDVCLHFVLSANHCVSLCVYVCVCV